MTTRPLPEIKAFAALFVWSAALLGALPVQARERGDLSPKQQQAYLEIMKRGSLNVSRTKAWSRRFMAPDSVKTQAIPDIAEKNFEKAAKYVLRNFRRLPLTLETATKLNKMLTKGLVPEDVRGKADFRRDPTPFYNWAASFDAKQLGNSDPVALAEVVHNRIATLDAFPDGNGRTSRLMADLVLLQNGRSPAYYTNIDDYFKRGAPRQPATRETQVPYFREISERGYATASGMLHAPKGQAGRTSTSTRSTSTRPSQSQQWRISLRSSAQTLRNNMTSFLGRSSAPRTR